MYWDSEGNAPQLMISTLNGGEWLALHPEYFSQGKKTPEPAGWVPTV
jgi:hypothetical protein